MRTRSKICASARVMHRAHLSPYNKLRLVEKGKRKINDYDDDDGEGDNDDDDEDEDKT